MQRMRRHKLRKLRPLMGKALRIGTRGSRLAMWQAETVRDALLAAHDDLEVEIVIVKTLGDGEADVTEIEHRVIDSREAHGLPMLGVAPSNIRRQVLRLRDVFIVEKVKTTYRVRENASLLAIFEEHMEQYYLASIISRIKEYLTV